MRARKVKGLDPGSPLLANASRIVATRLAELRSFTPAALAPDASQAQHDMRIAAKRLRYVLETVGVCLGECAEIGRRAARDLQDVLGEIHDCDERFALVERHLEATAADRGLELLLANTAESRDELHARFVRLWTDLQADGTWDRLATAAKAAAAHD